MTSADSAPGERPLVSYVIATYNRPADVAHAVESVLRQTYEPTEVVVSNSTDAEAHLFADGGPFDREDVHFHHSPERMGAPGSKNVALRKASGDIVVQLDDDAVLADQGATERVVELFDDHEDVGILAFQSRNFYTGERKPGEIPDPPAFDLTMDDSYRATNFVGVGTAFRRETLEAAGLYPDRFVYGLEEMDLSLRVHDAGYDVLYDPSLVVYHKKSQDGRRSDRETKERLVENRIRIAARNLPWRYLLFTTLLYTAYLGVLTRRATSIATVYRRLLRDRDEILAARAVVDGDTIARIKSRRTMLYGWWYGPHPRRIVGSRGDLERLTWEF
ncbi:MAG: glycosyltransferase family 2 protein [Haloarculaceae archaeon]